MDYIEIIWQKREKNGDNWSPTSSEDFYLNTTFYISDYVDSWQQQTFYIVDINDCLSSPCLHGACQDHPNDYACTCNHGYTGTDCDIGK